MSYGGPAPRMLSYVLPIRTAARQVAILARWRTAQGYQSDCAQVSTKPYAGTTPRNLGYAVRGPCPTKVRVCCTGGTAPRKLGYVLPIPSRLARLRDKMANCASGYQSARRYDCTASHRAAATTQNSPGAFASHFWGCECLHPFFNFGIRGTQPVCREPSEARVSVFDLLSLVLFQD